MKNTIRISVGIAALISAAALANAQTERPAPQGAATSESQTLGKERATETQPSRLGAEEKGAASEQRAQSRQTLEERGEHNESATQQGAEERNARQGVKQGAAEQGTTGEHRATQGQASEQERERAGQRGVSEQRGASEQGKATGAAEQGTAAEQRAQHGQQPYAQQGAQGRESMQQGAKTPARSGAQAARQQLQGHSRVQGAAISRNQQARIRDSVRNDRAARIDHADFGLSVGAVVPRSEHLAVLPPDVVAIAPRFRDYKFVIVEDEIVIVDPHTYRVTAVIPEAGGPSGPGAGPGGPGPRPGGPCG